MTEIKYGYEKIVQSGDLLEFYQYQKRPFPPRVRRKPRRRGDGPRLKTERHVKRAIFNFRRRVRATLYYGTPHLVTFTMWEIMDIGEAYGLFTQFGVRLREVFGSEIVWIAVPEFQKRGAVHFHALIWKLPYDIHEKERSDRAIQHLWGQGFVDIVATDGSPKLSGYLAKYMSKAMHDERLFDKKAYSCSRNALSPVSFNTQTSIAILKEEFGIDIDPNLRPTMEREYPSRWLGQVRYRAFENTIEKKES